MYRRVRSSWMKHWDFEILDIVLLELSYFIAYWIRHGNEWKFGQMYLRLALFLLVIDILLVLACKSYKNILQREFLVELFSVIEHVTVVALLVLLYEYFIKESDLLSRQVFLGGWLISIVVCLTGRLILKEIVRKRVSSARKQSNMLVISSESHIASCIKQIRQKEFREYTISAIAMPEDPVYNERIDANIPILYGKEALVDYIRQGVVDEVYIDTFESKDTLNHMVQIFLSMGITVHINMGFLPDDLPNRFMEKIGESYVVTTTIKTASSGELAFKRLIDIVGALVGLVITAVAFVFVAPAIKLSSPGPVFFKQQRVGKNGRIFYIYKFRSMYLDAEARKAALMEKNEMQGGLMFKMTDDPRIIGSEKGKGKGIGNFIRRTSIDELPQFYNILRGDMSLVGTRPPTLNEYEMYDLRHKIRLSMQPGLTGLWQVSGRSEVTDFNEVVRLDREYIENWSLLLDVKILLKTVKVVFERKGSK